MNDSISWDPSLVKKFSSSNHYKLLNQLRNEVKKYPLNNKKNLKSIKPKDIIDNQNKSNVPQVRIFLTVIIIIDVNIFKSFIIIFFLKYLQLIFF